jgi:hypothetical protein
MMEDDKKKKKDRVERTAKKGSLKLSMKGFATQKNSLVLQNSKMSAGNSPSCSPTTLKINT